VFLIALPIITALSLFSPPVSASGRVLSVIQQAVVGTERSYPPGTQRIEMLTLKFTASCDGNVNVQTLTVRHRGAGDPSDISALSVFRDGQRISHEEILSAHDGRSTLRPDSLIIPSCSSVTISVLASLAPSAAANGRHALIIDRPQDIGVLEKDVSISLQRQLPSVVQSVGPYQGGVTIETLPSLLPLWYGNHRMLARLLVTVDAVHDQTLQSILLTNDGSARGMDLQHLVLQRTSGELVTGIVDRLNGRLLRLTFDPPLKLPRSTITLFSLSGDIRASNRRSVHFIIAAPSDVLATSSSSR